MEYQKKILGILFIIAGAFPIVLLTLMSTVLFAISVEPFIYSQTYLPGMFKVISLTGSIMMVLLLALPSIIIGMGLISKKNWADDLVLPVGCFYLLFFPLGTAIGIYGLVVFFANHKDTNPSSFQHMRTSHSVH